MTGRPSRSEIARRVEELFGEGAARPPHPLFVRYHPSDDPETITTAWLQTLDAAGGDPLAACKQAYIASLQAGMDADSDATVQ